MLHVFKPWFSWRVLAIPISAGGTTQQSTRNPGGFWSTLRRGTLLNLPVFAKKKDLVEDVKVRSSFGCSDQ